LLTVNKWCELPSARTIEGMRKNAKLPKVLGKKVQCFRKRTGLSQEAVAFKVGISRAYMGYIEQGRNAPSLEVLQKVAKVLRVKLSDLLKKILNFTNQLKVVLYNENLTVE